MMAVFGIDFAIDIDQRGRYRLGVGDGKGEPVGGAWGMIGVLTENYDLYRSKISGKSAKNLRFGWKNGLSGIGLVEEGAEFAKVRLFELGFKKWLPTGVH